MAILGILNGVRGWLEIRINLCGKGKDIRTGRPDVVIPYGFDANIFAKERYEFLQLRQNIFVWEILSGERAK